jgi:hypothetical protein
VLLFSLYVHRNQAYAAGTGVNFPLFTVAGPLKGGGDDGIVLSQVFTKCCMCVCGGSRMFWQPSWGNIRVVQCQCGVSGPCHKLTREDVGATLRMFWRALKSPGVNGSVHPQDEWHAYICPRCECVGLAVHGQGVSAIICKDRLCNSCMSHVHGTSISLISNRLSSVARTGKTTYVSIYLCVYLSLVSCKLYLFLSGSTMIRQATLLSLNDVHDTRNH